MSTKRPLGWFITGTGTHVGKTYVTALWARALAAEELRVGVYKPAASGCRREQNEIVSDDALTLWRAAGSPLDVNAVCPQRFLAPLAPHLAARAEGRELDAAMLRRGLEPWLATSDVVLIEGAGGLLSPLGDNESVADLAHDLGFPLVIVAANELGVINAVLQTLFVAQHYRGGLPVAGVVLTEVSPPNHNDPSRASNAAQLHQRLHVPLLHVAHLATDCQELLAAAK